MLSWGSRIAAVSLLVCAAAIASGCRKQSGSVPKESQVSRSRLKLTLTTIPVESVEDIFAFRVTFENLDRYDSFLNLGDIHAGGCLHPDAIHLTLTDPRGKTRQLRFIKSPGHTDAAGGVSPYVVPLAAGSGYYRDLSLRQYAPSDAGELRLEPIPGRYRLRAEFVGTVPSSSDPKRSNFWTGKLRSADITFRIR